jgi:hypothetical protein
MVWLMYYFLCDLITTIDSAINSIIDFVWCLAGEALACLGVAVREAVAEDPITALFGGPNALPLRVAEVVLGAAVAIITCQAGGNDREAPHGEVAVVGGARVGVGAPQVIGDMGDLVFVFVADFGCAGDAIIIGGGDAIGAGTRCAIATFDTIAPEPIVALFRDPNAEALLALVCQGARILVIAGTLNQFRSTHPLGADPNVARVDRGTVAVSHALWRRHINLISNIPNAVRDVTLR